MNQTKSHYILLLGVIGLFLCIVGPGLFSQGMFSDGLCYAGLAHNMANGIGSFWAPKFTETHDSLFFGHPPLALGLQALLFKLFGSSYLIERFYCLIMALTSGYLLFQIWSYFASKRSLFWLPMLFFTSISTITWGYSNNMLEITMLVFLLLGFLFYLKSVQSFSWIILSGICIALGVLSKGVFSLFIWGVPGFYFLITRKETFKIAFIKTLVLIVFTLGPILLIYYYNPEAKHLLDAHIDGQLFNSVQNVTTVESRFKIVQYFFNDFVFVLLEATAIIGLFLWITKSKINISQERFRNGVFLIIVGISGIAPIMISLKQRPFYMFSAMPFLALGIGLFLEPMAITLLTKVSSAMRKTIKVLSTFAFILGIGLSIYFSTQFTRDANKIHDIKTVLEHTGEFPQIRITQTLYPDWSLRAYLVRYGHGTFHTFNGTKEKMPYFMCKKPEIEEVPKEFQRMEIGLIDYELFERID